MADWNAHLSYAAPQLGHKNYTLYRIPVSHFKVKGGAKRVVTLAADDDISLVSELEQAIRFQNLVVLCEVGLNFDWVFDLLEIAARDLPVSIEFFVDGHQGKTLTHAFRLVCKTARIEQPQETSQSDGANRFLPVKFAIPGAKLIHGAHEDGQMIEEEW